MIEAVDDDGYSDAEQERLARNLLALADDVHRGHYLAQACDGALLHELHRRLFDGVRDHGGRSRSRDFGSEWLNFGPNRSVDRDRVPGRLDALFAELGKYIRSFDDDPNDPEYSTKAVHLAAWVHAELIKIHPFQDGNGRSTRAFMNAVLVRLGMRPIAVETCKQEYCETLNYYYERGDRQPLVDLFLRLYAAELRNR